MAPHWIWRLGIILFFLFPTRRGLQPGLDETHRFSMGRGGSSAARLQLVPLGGGGRRGGGVAGSDIWGGKQKEQDERGGKGKKKQEKKSYDPQGGSRCEEVSRE
jgi:hypothetical protein